MMLQMSMLCVTDKCWKFWRQCATRIRLNLLRLFIETLAVCLGSRSVSFLLSYKIHAVKSDPHAIGQINLYANDTVM